LNEADAQNTQNNKGGGSESSLPPKLRKPTFGKFPFGKKRDLHRRSHSLEPLEVPPRMIPFSP